MFATGMLCCIRIDVEAIYELISSVPEYEVLTNLQCWCNEITIICKVVKCRSRDAAASRAKPT